MGFVSKIMIDSQSPIRWFCTEDLHERHNGFTSICEEKLIPEWFLLDVLPRL